MCNHPTQCPDADAANAACAQIVAPHHLQGWSLLCNGVVLFDDGLFMLPDRTTGRIAGPDQHPQLHLT
jgi:hypothetical protein